MTNRSEGGAGSLGGGDSDLGGGTTGSSTGSTGGGLGSTDLGGSDFDTTAGGEALGSVTDVGSTTGGAGMGSTMAGGDLTSGGTMGGGGLTSGSTLSGGDVTSSGSMGAGDVSMGGTMGGAGLSSGPDVVVTTGGGTDVGETSRPTETSEGGGGMGGSLTGAAIGALAGAAIGAAASALGGSGSEQGSSSTEHSIEVNAPVSTVYNQWTQFEEFPRFMQGVEQVHQLDDKRLHWKADIGFKDKEWYAEITDQVPDQLIAWRSTSGAPNGGMVTFLPIGADRTQVTLRIDYDPQGLVESVGDKLGLVSRRVEGDLQRFKEFIESRGTETGAWRGQI